MFVLIQHLYVSVYVSLCIYLSWKASKLPCYQSIYWTYFSTVDSSGLQVYTFHLFFHTVSTILALSSDLDVIWPVTQHKTKAYLFRCRECVWICVMWKWRLTFWCEMNLAFMATSLYGHSHQMSSIPAQIMTIICACKCWMSIRWSCRLSFVTCCLSFCLWFIFSSGGCLTGWQPSQRYTRQENY